MGISKFMFLLIMLTFLFLFMEKEIIIPQKQKIIKPKVSFFDSTMYEITEKNINQIVKSEKADIYDKKEELFDATVIVRSNKNTNDTNIVSSNSMIKKDNLLFLQDSVNLQLSDGTNIKTEQLDYNLETKIATNKVPFVAIQETNSFLGDNLFLNSVSEHLKAKNAKFRMKVE